VSHLKRAIKLTAAAAAYVTGTIERVTVCPGLLPHQGNDGASGSIGNQIGAVAP
jgi:hypothetical protein